MRHDDTEERHAARTSRTFKRIVPSLMALTLGMFALPSFSAFESMAGKTVRVLCDPSNTPFEIRDDKGTMTGFNVELMKEIAARNGFNVTFVGLKAVDVYNFLDQDKVDIVASMATFDPAMDGKYLFSEPVHANKNYMYMLPDVADKYGIKSFEDGCKLSVAVRDNSDKSRLLEKICKDDADNVHAVKTSLLAMKYIATGQVEAAVSSDLAANYLIENRSLGKMTSFPAPEGFDSDIRWIMKKDDYLFKRVVDTTLKNIKDDGTYKRLYDKWLHPNKIN